MTFTLDWSSIRPLNGGRDKGFEELCSQLARLESPSGACFVRKGTPDAGVECYAVLSNDSEWAWQSKYFDVLGDSQWQQLDKSVSAAIEKHPRLVRYYVCIPLDLPDARIDGQKSAKDRWDDRVKKWRGWADEKGLSVEFAFWGSHEMLERLARTENVGRVRFWFDKRGFDGAWFSARLSEALRAAGPRYTPDVHVTLPIAQDFQAFGRTELFFDRIKSLAISIREKLPSTRDAKGASVDPEVAAAAAVLSAATEVVLDGFGALEPQPAGGLRFQSLAAAIEKSKSAAQDLSILLEKREQAYDANPPPGKLGEGTSTRHRSNPFRDRRFMVGRLSNELERANEDVRRADQFAGSSLVLLRGQAGTGKTHLLCDVATDRLEENMPTVLLMGQRFISNDPPWTQLLQQLDLTGMSAEQFVGALEAAAQASGRRALLVIDAINEGNGRVIWPSHMSAFLAQIEGSEWVGVVLSVRSSYEELVVPADVRDRAITVTHHGFRKHEYDATKTFFVHYGLELPSTPLLAPEFRNPLFLKTLCEGLHAKGERRLPRGLQGISAVFELHLGAVNKRLAQQLGFDERTPLVQRALDAIAAALVERKKRWLTLDQAKSVVDDLLPGRDFERSLFRGLVVEGVVAEEAPMFGEDGQLDIVYVAYERLADHRVAKTLLDRHVDPTNPGAAFTDGGELAFVANADGSTTPGLLEAMFIQVAERWGTELLTLAPTIATQWGAGNAFRQSVIWRSYAAFSDGTRDSLNELCRSDDDEYDTFDVLLTVATLPGNPFNAYFLDRNLREVAMADRDAWWSVYLHHAWGTHSAVDRLVDWATSLDHNASLDDDAVDLCAIALSWMLTTSNRFLRDRATKALVNLLTRRIAAVIRVVERFADVDDPYVAERVYAVAYGVAMRCHDPALLGPLALCVYRHAFASESPPPHILLRDYARGVVERAIHVGATIDVIPERIRPPYKSTWPNIPTDEEIKPLLPDWSKGSHDSMELEWGRNRIGNSVMDDDFAHYVIGTNASSDSSDWLSLGLDEPMWSAPPRPEDQLRQLVGELSPEERKAWAEFEAADKARSTALESFVGDWLARRQKEATVSNDSQSDLEALEKELATNSPPELSVLNASMTNAEDALRAILSAEHAERLAGIQDAKNNAREARRPPRFDLRQIQRYILKRVFDLGWTEERFGHFDRFSIRSNGREASKAERIGKKYQWIAYHEILALVSDRFQLREMFRGEDGDRGYDGPWQVRERDIDPSCTMRSLRGGTSWDGHAPAWWCPAPYSSWGVPNNSREWVLNSDDLPKVDELLMVTHPGDGTRWLNVQGYFNWKQQPPADRKSIDVEHREIWYVCTGYLLRADDAETFMRWAEGVDFWGRWMPEPGEVYWTFLGEHPWAPAAHYFHRQHCGDDCWVQPRNGCPLKVRTLSIEHLSEARNFDCSLDESFTLRLPVNDLATALGIQWTGRGGDFADPRGQIVAQDPTVHDDGPTACLFREDKLREFMSREKLALGWAVLGEKRVLGAGFGTGRHHAAVRMTGAYVLQDKGPAGFLKCWLDNPAQSESERKALTVIRSGM